MHKSCFKCGVEKPLTDFYKHPKMPDGHVNKCKECNKKDVRKNRAENFEHYQAYDKERDQRQDRKDMKERYQKGAGREVANAAKGRYSENNPKKRKAHWAVNNAVRDGKLFKEPCEVCRSEKVKGQHDDYSKPLEVRWLCPIHHEEWHRENGPGLNGD